MILAIDFDDTISDTAHPVPGRRMGAPLPGAQKALEDFKRKGDTIIIHCFWGDEKGIPVIAKWMEYYKIPYDSITNIKPNADWFIDNKNIVFTNWADIKI
jgi:hypothetical protein